MTSLFVIIVNTFFFLSVTLEILENNNGSVLISKLSIISRRPRETIVGNGCPKGRIWYHGKCKLLKELRDSDYNDFSFTNEPQQLIPKTTVQKAENESTENDLILEVLPLPKIGTTIQNTTELICNETEIILDAATRPTAASTEEPKKINGSGSSTPKVLVESEATFSKTDTPDTLPSVHERTTLVTQVDCTSDKDTFLNDNLPDANTGSTFSTIASANDKVPSVNQIFELTTASPVTRITSNKELLFEDSIPNDDMRPKHLVTDLDSTEPGLSVTPNNFLTTDQTPIFPTSLKSTVGITTAATVSTGLMDSASDFEISPRVKQTTSDDTLQESLAKSMDTYSTSAPEQPPILIGTGTTDTEGDSLTTVVQNKDSFEVIGNNDKTSNVLYEFKSIMFTLLFIVSGAVILIWIFETVFSLILRRQGENNRNIPILLKFQALPLNKKEESIV